MQKVSIARALTELKTLEDRINKTINSFISCGTKTGKRLPPGWKTQEDMEKKIKSDYQQITDLIKRYNRIKTEIAKSNATTTLTVGGEQMTVAEAINKKHSINFEINLGHRVGEVYDKYVKAVDGEMERVKTRLDQHIQALCDKESSKLKKEEYDNIAVPFLEANEPVLIDPLNISSLLSEYEERINNFKNDVDSALTESNVRTEIEI